MVELEEHTPTDSTHKCIHHQLLKIQDTIKCSFKQNHKIKEHVEVKINYFVKGASFFIDSNFCHIEDICP